MCTKVKGEPLYEVVKQLDAHQELVVYYLPESPARPEELFFVHMRSTLYRRTMDSILEGIYSLVGQFYKSRFIHSSWSFSSNLKRSRTATYLYDLKAPDIKLNSNDSAPHTITHTRRICVNI